MLKINELNANIDNKDILKGLSLNINPGEVHANSAPPDLIIFPSFSTCTKSGLI